MVAALSSNVHFFLREILATAGRVLSCYHKVHIMWSTENDKHAPKTGWLWLFLKTKARLTRSVGGSRLGLGRIHYQWVCWGLAAIVVYLSFFFLGKIWTLCWCPISFAMEIEVKAGFSQEKTNAIAWELQKGNILRFRHVPFTFLKGLKSLSLCFSMCKNVDQQFQAGLTFDHQIRMTGNYQKAWTFH